MVMSRFRGYVIAALIAVVRAPEVAVDFIERTAAAIFNFIAPAFKHTRDFRVAYDGPALDIDRGSLDPALRHSLRHEAGTRQRAAGRGG